MAVTGGQEPETPPSSAGNTADMQTLFPEVRDGDVHAYIAFSYAYGAVADSPRIRVGSSDAVFTCLSLLCVVCRAEGVCTLYA